MVRNDDRSSKKSICDDEEGLPRDSDEVSRDGYEEPIRMVVIVMRFQLLARLQDLTRLTSSDRVRIVRFNAWPKHSLSCSSLCTLCTSVAVVKANEGAATKSSKNHDICSVKDIITISGETVP